MKQNPNNYLSLATLPVSLMDSQRWNWRMQLGTNPGDAINPTPSQIWLGANAASPSATHPWNLLTGAVLTHPSLTATKIRVRLYQELAIRRDASRRRARSSPCQSAVSCQWAGTVTLGTGVHKGGVVADINVADVNAIPSLSTDPSSVRQWMFGARLPEDMTRTWTWTACEGDRKKIWFLDMRYRVIAEAYHNDQLVGAARSFVSFCPTTATYPVRVGCSRAPSASRSVRCPPMEFSEDLDSSLSETRKTSAEFNNWLVSGSSSEEDQSLLMTRNGFQFRRRTAMAFTRQPEDTLKRPRHPDKKSSLAFKRSVSLLGSRSERASYIRGEPLTSLGRHSSQPASQSSSNSQHPRWDSFKSTKDFDDMTVTTTIHVPSKPPTPSIHAQFRLTEQINASISLVPKMGLSQLKITAVLTEVIEIVDDAGTRQVHLQHHYRMGVTLIPTTASRRQEITCTAQMTAADKLFSADTYLDFMRVTHRLDVSVSYERRRVLGGLLFGEITPAEHDLWDIVDGTGMKVVSSTPFCLLHGEKPEQQATVPWLAVWGSTERIAAVGTAESRSPRRKPGWATSDAGESQKQTLESKIDMLRSLAYANAGSRRREESPSGRIDERIRRFSTFRVDDSGPLAKQSCPVCLERLDGVVTMLPCLHAGHRSCFSRSQNPTSVCPVCRLDLSPYVNGEPGKVRVGAT